MSDNIIGKPQRRIDGGQKVSGQARYAADHPMNKMLYAYGVYSTIANGRVVAINDQQAKAMPGVVDIFHHGNFPTLHRTPNTKLSFAKMLSASKADEHRLPFEDDKVYYPGQFVALVVAESFEQARAAAHRVTVDYDQRPAVKDLQEGLRVNGTRDGGAGHNRGNPDGAFQSAKVKVDQTYTTPVEVHNPMEMHASTAWWQDGKLFVYESTQGVVNHRNLLANVFDLSPDRVEVRAPFIGSGFGGKLWPWPHSVATCAAAQVTGRPVQLVLPRAQMFTTVGHRPETRQRLRLATDASGKLTSIRHESLNNTSMLDDYTENCGGVTKSLYSCENVMVSHKISPINRGTPTSMRAPGAAPGLFALESAIDEMALASGMDPLAFRKLNLSDKDQSVGLPWSSNHLPEAIDKAAERFGWQARKAAVGSMREGDEIIGYGMGACNWEAHQVPTDARVVLRSDGTALAQCGLQDIGTGTYTIVAQAVSELTGIPIERVEVELGSSSFPPGPVSGGSWVTASVMPAIAGATREALQKLRQYAISKDAVFAGQDPESIKVENGQLVMGEQRASFVDVLKGQRLSRAEGNFQSGMPEAGKYSFRSFGVHFVEVRWDPGISSLRVSRVVSAIDVGKVINPLAARNQVEGAIVMGIGMALFEAGEYDPRSGMPVNNNYAEYVVPVHADQPDIDVMLLDYPDYNLGEFGARGIGEIGVTGLAAAVANAVYHATGKRVRSLPITKEKLMAGL
ncbi:xanthine dehydrogenase family protein molybdopterin-binding subunit [Pseudomonas syringae group genomosp. 3]|uniref:xanthine dehydrogenase family protein molybdopterin-binding subunit n=1 Tax=Pseudomonas syringae group genomosp. 3 TaxID=251701 RepID=UPI0006E70709|nr:xanthine dehydrogenase family protein molybdopterin-binding subunit [Pseudomonas syringae group genomosp. 3]KPY13080.1 Aldehyde oxidase and xanthine dehydrogenase, a/b hammerhead:Aldehyde oxidase and xanthine dehydrogenase, molybdopterin binding [Pseudomonas syringae pv. philadelphi]RMM17752.1 Aldehyde oxidase and xanthine dehydrogenase [Pseudomonas syringae pv. berberidis]RMP65532.1 Aldehyde oxidase and xanthine dehydrogenase, a/b hammerhead:Aldehyde oxidase and xanthine dehydrogenase, molyb